MPRHCLQSVLTGELALESQRFDINCKDLEVVVMHDTVIPRRAGTVIAAVGAFHLGVTREPSRVSRSCRSRRVGFDLLTCLAW
jgi:hypothetical protein